MSRALLIACACVVVLVPARASAIRVQVNKNTIEYRCREAKTWGAVTTCITSLHRTLRIVRTLGDAKLIQLERPGVEPSDDGLALYVKRRDGWSLAEHYNNSGTYQVLALESVTLNHRTGYRMEIGSAVATSHQIGESRLAAVLVRRETMYCSGATTYCPSVATSCDVLVHGTAYAAFRLTPVIEGDEIRLVGDRSLTGGLCIPEDDVQLGWSD